MLTFKTVTELVECKNLWEKFSPKKILWDLWDFRYCFHNNNFKFNFILGLDGKEQIGVLPLVNDKREDIYIYFGDMFPERNKFLLKDKKLLSKFLEDCPEGTSIYYISEQEAKFYDFMFGEKRYFLNLEKYEHSFENYLKSFTKKHRKNLRYDLKKLKEKGYEIEINNIKDFEKLIFFNKQRFGKDSDYNNEDFVLSMRKLLDAASKMKILDMISIKVDSNTEAVGLGVFYNKCYYVLGVGRNKEIKNLGKLLISEQIKNAIRHKCDEIDFLSTESNWKELWNLDSEQMYEYHDEFIEI